MKNRPLQQNLLLQKRKNSRSRNGSQDHKNFQIHLNKGLQNLLVFEFIRKSCLDPNFRIQGTINLYFWAKVPGFGTTVLQTQTYKIFFLLLMGTTRSQTRSEVKLGISFLGLLLTLNSLMNICR